jgi:hypothetical protein
MEKDNTVSFGTGLALIICFVASVLLVLTIASLVVEAEAKQLPNNIEVKNK